MKSLFCLSAVVLSLSATARPINFSEILSHKNGIAGPRASFDKLWIDYDITEDGIKGMRIHVKFSVYEMKGVDGYVAIFFEDDWGDRLKDNNKKYYSSGGDVALYKSIKPAYDPAEYNDLQLFMPYSELDLEPGNYDLSMEVRLIYPNGDLIQHLTFHDFEYTKPGAGGQNSNSSATATFEKIWVDYNVTENGRTGMRVHVKFKVLNMKNIDSYLAIYFEKKNGDKLYTNNTTYRAKNGQVAIFKSLLPAYDETLYNDLQLFMPYSEFNLGKGKFDLKLDADVIYKNGDLVKHLSFHEFWLDQ
jgi:hypothetical protein